MTTKAGNLTAAETDRLKTCETAISKGIASFVDVGRALTEIRDEKLYRATHKTFEAYCKERWEIGRSRAYELIDQAEVIDTIYSTVDLSAAADISKRDVRAIIGDLPAITQDIKSRVAAGETPEKAVAGAITARRAQKDKAKGHRTEVQADNDRQRDEARAALPEHIKRIETAKHANGARNAAVPGSVSDDVEAVTAERDELREENAALKADLAERDATITKFDDMAVQYEKGGFEAVIATKDERIRVLQRQVEDISADRASLARSRDFWMKQAKGLGYVSPNSEVVDEEPQRVVGHEYEPF